MGSKNYSQWKLEVLWEKHGFYSLLVCYKLSTIIWEIWMRVHRWPGMRGWLAYPSLFLMILSFHPSWATYSHGHNLDLGILRICNFSFIYSSFADYNLLSFQCSSFFSRTPPVILLGFPIHWSHHLLLTLTKLYIFFLPLLLSWIPVVTDLWFYFCIYP